uniref:Uncharacterized protein n=1 Tax=Anopheles stephensi TaxID=30069 RepID=A0A182YRF5_ANOST
MYEEIYLHELDTGMAESAEYEEEWISFTDEEDEEEVDAEQHVFKDDDEANRNNTFSKKLQLWALSHRITHAALNDLLEIVQETTEYYVPKDARTFLKTPVGVGKQIASVAGGQLWYQGIQNTLQYHFRTDAEFRSGQYAIGHQRRPTPIADITGLDIIKHIPVSDDLHLLYSGFMKLFVVGHAEGTLSSFPKWTLEEQEEVSTILLKTRLPVEINRAMRSLKYVKFWKGSEFRTFLNHISIPLLKGRIHDDAYHHFKLFYVAITLLSSSILKDFGIMQKHF